MVYFFFQLKPYVLWEAWCSGWNKDGEGDWLLG